MLIFNIHAISTITPVSIYGFTGFKQERFAILLKEKRISYIEKISLNIIGEWEEYWKKDKHKIKNIESTMID